MYCVINEEIVKYGYAHNFPFKECVYTLDKYSECE